VRRIVPSGFQLQSSERNLAPETHGKEIFT
jgi:hypothetical protein